jgi:hypothetical protein
MALLSGELEGVVKEGSIGGVVGMSGWLPFRKEIGEVLANCSSTGVEGKRRWVREYVRNVLEPQLGSEGGEGTYFHPL